MMKAENGTRQSRTYFEQVPLDEVRKRIARDQVHVEPGSDKLATDSQHFHGVQFYDHPDALCRIVGGFLGEGLEQGALAVIIATPDHAARVDACLRARGLDVDALRRDGRIVTFDARETLQLFMANAVPNASAFRRAIGSALTRVRRGREQCAIRAYGEMVDLLWKDGLEAAAIRVETLWNQLARTQDFELLCGYAMGNFYKGSALEAIHNQHSHLIDRDGHATVLTDHGAASATAS